MHMYTYARTHVRTYMHMNQRSCMSTHLHACACTYMRPSARVFYEVKSVVLQKQFRVMKHVCVHALAS